MFIKPDVKVELTDDASNIPLPPAVETIRLPPPGLVNVAMLFTLLPLTSCFHIWLLLPVEVPAAVKVGTPSKLSIIVADDPDNVAEPTNGTVLPKQIVEVAGLATIEVAPAFTICDLVLVGLPHPPVAVKVKVAVPL